MSLSPEAIDALVAAGASAEMLAAAFKAELAADQARKAAQRATLSPSGSMKATGAGTVATSGATAFAANSRAGAR